MHFGCPQGEHAQAILAMAKQFVLSDEAFVARVRRHYAMFREEVENDARPRRDSSRRKIGRNDPCPCGSGRKYKKCCFEKDRAHGGRQRPPAI
ncbi:MAG: SEC-C metal-binding domain-containing protein [Planctomycetota bacterium]